jgi:hypothetical protein
MDETVQLTVRLPRELHRAARIKCLERGDSLQGVAQAAFASYVGRAAGDPGSPLERAGVESAPARVLPEHRADPRDRASMEHGPREPAAAKGMCEHRVPLGSYCKRCEEEL